jgi:hypothetical protein
MARREGAKRIAKNARKARGFTGSLFPATTPQSIVHAQFKWHQQRKFAVLSGANVDEQ